MARIIYTDMSGVEQTISIGHNYPVVTIGRAVDCDIRSNRKSVSRHHAEFKFSNNQVHVVDLNSSNGTFVIIDDQRRAIIGQQMIAPNDEVWCGDFVLRYVSDAGVQDNRPPIPTFTSSPEVAFASHPTDRPLSGSQPLGLGLTPAPNPPQFGANNNPPPGLLEQSGFDPLTDDIDEIERLMAEKSSIEDLATRQAMEIDRLESLIGSVKEDAASSALVLQTQRDQTEQEKKQLEKQLEAQQESHVLLDLENEVVELRGLNDKLRVELSESGEEQKTDFEIQLAQKNAEIDELGVENEKLASMHDAASNQLEQTNQEIQTLKSELDALNQKLSSNEASIKADTEWEAQISALNREKEALRTANEALSQQSEDQNLTVSDLNDKVLLLEREKEELSAKIPVEEPSAPNAELVTFLTSLDRLVDAIQRTDFSVLSTVDRVRLQSAIRETKPKITLQAFIEKHK